MTGKEDALEGLALPSVRRHKDGGTSKNALAIHNYPASRSVIKINFNLTVKFKLHTESTSTQKSKAYYFERQDILDRY